MMKKFDLLAQGKEPEEIEKILASFEDPNNQKDEGGYVDDTKQFIPNKYQHNKNRRKRNRYKANKRRLR